MTKATKDEAAEAVGSSIGGTLEKARAATISSPSIPQGDAPVKTWLRALLSDDALPEIPPDYAGPWADELKAVAGAHHNGGKDAARRAFNALAKNRPVLAELVAGDASPQRFMSWSQLLAAQFDDPVWAIPDLLPTGLTFLAGRPKLGKSWLALQIAQAVATGGVALGVRVERGSVLYLALEDSLRRIRERGKLQSLPDGAPVEFATAWEPLAEGGLATLQAAMDDRRPRLVVIDTFSRVAGRADQQDVGQMTAILANLQRAAMDHDLALLCIDHHRKPAGMEANPIDDLLGSTAKSAVADAAWGLYREQGAHAATLRVTGRDIDERELALSFDGLTMCWQPEGEAGQVRHDSLQANILAAIRDLGVMGELSTTTRIATHVGRDKPSVSRALAEMVNKGKVVKGAKIGRQQPYLIPGQVVDE